MRRAGLVDPDAAGRGQLEGHGRGACGARLCESRKNLLEGRWLIGGERDRRRVPRDKRLDCADLRPSVAPRAGLGNGEVIPERRRGRPGAALDRNEEPIRAGPMIKPIVRCV